MRTTFVDGRLWCLEVKDCLLLGARLWFQIKVMDTCCDVCILVIVWGSILFVFVLLAHLSLQLELIASCVTTKVTRQRRPRMCSNLSSSPVASM